MLSCILIVSALYHHKKKFYKHTARYFAYLTTKGIKGCGDTFDCIYFAAITEINTTDALKTEWINIKDTFFADIRAQVKKYYDHVDEYKAETRSQRPDRKKDTQYWFFNNSISV